MLSFLPRLPEEERETRTARSGTMSYMLEVYYRAPADAAREAALTSQVESLGGCLTYREDPPRPGTAIVLTYEFPDFDRAESAAGSLRAKGEHVEGPVSYPD
jgi:hypothetical protein